MGANADRVMQVLGALRSGDTDSAGDVASDDFVWHVPGSSVISGDTAGLAASSARLRRLVDAGLQPEMIAVLEGDDHVVSVQRNTASVGDERLDVKVLSLFTITDGKVARWETFFGDQVHAESFWNAVLDPEPAPGG